MKKIALVVWLSMVATLAYANCSTSTVTYGGKMTTCTTCCYNGSCNTTCF